ncbi:hypothetical protein EMGBS15_15660 [Filimonas sp.]|nr:hypothetical protein EMGBS15_15660 [Filimonas sp.]
MKKMLLFALISVCCSGCFITKKIIIKKVFRNPRVENTASIRSFLTKNKFDTTHSYLFKSDTVKDKTRQFIKRMFTRYAIFNSEGQRLCYNGNATCGGVQFKELIAGKKDSFSSCSQKTLRLQEELPLIMNFKRKPVTFQDLPRADYYLLKYWSKAQAGRKGYEEEIGWMEDEIEHNKAGLKIIFIKVNFDIKAEDGFQSGAKIPFHVYLNNGGTDIKMGPIPMKK